MRNLKKYPVTMKRKSVMNFFMTRNSIANSDGNNHKSFILLLPPTRHDLSLHSNHYCHLMIPFSFFVTNLLCEIACKFKCHQLSSHCVFNLATSGSTNIKKKFAFVLDWMPFKKYYAQVWRREHKDINFLQDYPR